MLSKTTELQVAADQARAKVEESLQLYKVRREEGGGGDGGGGGGDR